MMKLEDYKCVDSIPATTNLNLPMIYTWGSEEKIDALNKNGNLRTDAHVIIFNNWLKVEEMETTEKKRLKDYVKELNIVIPAISKMRHLTNVQSEKETYNKRNIHNRAKLKIVESML